MQYIAKHQEVIEEHDRKKALFKQIFTDAKQLVIVSCFIGGDTMMDLLSKTSAKLWVVCHSDLLENECKNIIKNKAEQHIIYWSTIMSCIHTKYIIVDNRYVFTGSSNYIEQSFGYHEDKKNFLTTLINNLFYEIDVWIDCRNFAEYLTDYTNKKFKFNIPFQRNFSSKISVHGQKIGFNCHLFDPDYTDVNPITKRLVELIEKSDDITFSVKNFSPVNEIREVLKDKKFNFFTSLGNSLDIASKANIGACYDNLSDFVQCKIWNHKNENVMWHHKVYIFRIGTKTHTLIGSYNLTYRSHYMDTELLLEYEKPIVKMKRDLFDHISIDFLTQPSFWHHLIVKFMF